MYFDFEAATNPGASLRADVASGAAPRERTSRGYRSLEGLILRSLIQNVRHSSSFPTTEIEIEARGTPAPLSATQKLRERPAT